MSQLAPYHHCPGAAHTEELGERLAEELRTGDVVLLEGDLAAGKTTFVRGMVRRLGGDPGEVTSPTFVILQTYPCRRGTTRQLHHVDLYRIEDAKAELREIGIEEVLSDPEAVVAVEWPRRSLVRWLPSDARRWQVFLTLGQGDVREIEIRGPIEAKDRR